MLAGQYLLGALMTALPSYYSAGAVSVRSRDKSWWFQSEVIDNKLTGKILLACNDPAALAEFKRLASGEDYGHEIEDVPGWENQVLITPAPQH